MGSYEYYTLNDKDKISVIYSRSEDLDSIVNRNKVLGAENINFQRRLQLQLNDDLRFISEWWQISLFGNAAHSNGDGRILDGLQLNIDDKWVTFHRNEIDNYDSWQKIYEDLIERVAEKKRKDDEKIVETFRRQKEEEARIQNERLDKAKEKLQEFKELGKLLSKEDN